MQSLILENGELRIFQNQFKKSQQNFCDIERIMAELKVDLIMLLADNGYPPVNKDEVYKEIFEQAENFKKYNYL